MNLFEEIEKHREEYRSVFEVQEALRRVQEILRVYGTILTPPTKIVLSTGTTTKDTAS